jgi:hypothetical protein
MLSTTATVRKLNCIYRIQRPSGHGMKQAPSGAFLCPRLSRNTPKGETDYRSLSQSYAGYATHGYVATMNTNQQNERIEYGSSHDGPCKDKPSPPRRFNWHTEEPPARPNRYG